MHVGKFFSRVHRIRSRAIPVAGQLGVSDQGMLGGVFGSLRLHRIMGTITDVETSLGISGGAMLLGYGCQSIRVHTYVAASVLMVLFVKSMRLLYIKDSSLARGIQEQSSRCLIKLTCEEFFTYSSVYACCI